MSTNNKNRNRRQGQQGNRKPAESNAYFASASVTIGASNPTNIKGIKENRLKLMLADPSKNAVEIAEISKSVNVLNGIYGEIVKYKSSLLTYDHTIYPVMENPMAVVDDVDALKMAFAQTAIFLDRLNPKYHLPLFTYKALVSGVVYLYKVEDKDSVAYMEFPISMCRVSYIENGVYRFEFDVTKIKAEHTDFYPNEIQKGFKSYQSGNTKKLVEGKWLQISDLGVAFTMDPNVLGQGGFSLPPMSSSLLDAIKIEGAKEQMEDMNELDNTKIIHSKIETDSNGRPTMEADVAKIYHTNLKNNLPKGAVAITNPFATTGITLNGTGKDGKFALLDKSVENLYNGAGISKMLFAGDGTSSKALDRSIQVDAQWLYSLLLPMYSSYYNYELKKVSKKGSYWKTKFLPVSNFDRQDAIKTSKDQLSNGGSRLEYLAYTGMSPLEVANMLVFEQQVLSIDDFMVAKQTSFTMGADESGGANKNEPPKKELSDDTIRIQDADKS